MDFYSVKTKNKKTLEELQKFAFKNGFTWMNNEKDVIEIEGDFFLSVKISHKRLYMTVQDSEGIDVVSIKRFKEVLGGVKERLYNKKLIFKNGTLTGKGKKIIKEACKFLKTDGKNVILLDGFKNCNQCNVSSDFEECFASGDVGKLLSGEKGTGNSDEYMFINSSGDEKSQFICNDHVTNSQVFIKEDKPTKLGKLLLSKF